MLTDTPESSSLSSGARRCCYCGGGINTSCSHAVYCSVKCRGNFANKVHRGNICKIEASFSPTKCKRCGKPFLKKNSYHAFCSNTCKSVLNARSAKSRAKIINRTRRLRQERLAKGLCIFCNDPHSEGRNMCEKHWIKAKNWEDVSYAKKHYGCCWEHSIIIKNIKKEIQRQRKVRL